MTFLELVNRRRSTRKYTSRPVPKEAMTRCLEAARLAPSACNSQPWHFIVVDDEALKNKLADAAFSGMYSMNSFAKSAPAFVVVTRDRSKYFATIAGYFRGIRYSFIDIGIACEHFILQAEEDGIGTCWLGWFNERAVRKLLGIPGNKKADIMICMGYPEETQKIDKIRKSMDEISRFNK
ncbi:MAG: nitroreductase family protein [Candidatus Omnitrophica bacterium]|nr:nitroreductase family protein [Candidatus Omnitrophota bacterium]